MKQRTRPGTTLPVVQRCASAANGAAAAMRSTQLLAWRCAAASKLSNGALLEVKLMQLFELSQQMCKKSANFSKNEIRKIGQFVQPLAAEEFVDRAQDLHNSKFNKNLVCKQIGVAQTIFLQSHPGLQTCDFGAILELTSTENSKMKNLRPPCTDEDAVGLEASR